MKKQVPPLHDRSLKERLTGKVDAIEILTQDHRKVQKLFREFQKLVEQDDGNTVRKEEIVREACALLTIHAMVEEEIFYPAVARAVGDNEIMNIAKVEHDGCNDLIEQLGKMRAGDEFFDARFIVLGEAMNLHIREEEHDMFPRVHKSGLDLDLIGRHIEKRQQELLVERGMDVDYIRDINLTSPHAKAVLTKEGLLP
ncbi:MAG: hemerythrin domain-containing protein [Micavibrio sp.]|nr:hemerythrin domain-containing protein [Micavibrio sp.]